ncbi:hypothetical protein [Bacillus safensis]|uniref:hypothetical protein n=1 Tax=Bacillus safensis TaxID=561879 RepID=UPI002282BFDE|nr:hypothetical protein [Bacillus safensis]MCY7711261.1 hypothetical protein [Bacillus safensis]
MAALKGVKMLDMVDGEITKVSYEGAEFERVEDDAKVGDLVLNGRIHPDLTADGFYEVIREELTGWVSVKDDIGDYHSRVLGITKTSVFRKKHVRLKVGDYAKVVDEGEISITGDIVKITEDDRGNIPFRCAVITGKGAGDYLWAQESELVLATEVEVAAAKEAEEKRSIEAKWAKIGRKVDEYKVGYFVAYDDPAYFKNDGIGEVITDSTYDCGPEIKAIGRSGYYEDWYVRKSSLTLITPVEARFDRS